MLPKTCLTSHSRMSGSRWVITPLWLSGFWKSFLYSYSVYLCHLFLILSAFVRSIPFLSFIVLIFAWNVPLISLIFEEISSLSHSILFLYFFAPITEEGFLPHFMAYLWGLRGSSERFWWAPKSLLRVTAVMKFKDTCSLKGSYDKPRQCINKQRHHFVNEGPHSQSYGFFSSHVMKVRVGPWSRLSTKELMLSYCGAEDSWESPGLQGDWKFVARNQEPHHDLQLSEDRISIRGQRRGFISWNFCVIKFY